MKRIIFLFTSLIVAFTVQSQSTDYPLSHHAYAILDYAAGTHDRPFFTKVKPYSRRKVIAYAEKTEMLAFNRQYLMQDNREWSGDTTRSKKTLGAFFQYPADFYAVQTEDIDLHVNPVIHFRAGSGSDSDQILYENSRGLEIRGRIDDKIAFYTMLSENQALFPAYVNQYRDSVGAIPYEGFWKRFGDDGADFFRAEGYVDFGVTDHVSLQLGYGRHFIGDGQRSLILSDFGNRYPYLRVETEVWRIKYTNLFAQLITNAAFSAGGTLGNEEFPQKFLAMHHLDVSVTDNLNIGLFESVVYGEPDSLGGGIKTQYLNPILFYRALEQQDGSPDNVILGADFNWHLWNRLTLYGQLVIDEMIVSELFSGNGWWGSKQGFQLGAKYFDAFGVSNLMVQGELNAIRPYTYAHRDNFTSYSHYNMPLAHPLGANFIETVGKIDYQFLDRWRLQMVGVWAAYGDDVNGENFGRDVTRSYRDRDKNGNGIADDNYGNEWLQGDQNSLQLINGRLSYQARHNLFIDGDLILRNESSEGQSTIFGLSVRWNFPERFYLF